jgi:uncharacterized protein YcfJ
MQTKKVLLAAVGSCVLLSACAHAPLGPMVSVLPSPNKPFEVFQEDELTCRQFAEQQTQGGVEAANNRAVAAGALTTGLGAILGAAAGGGRGAGIGAATGAVVGTAVGANFAEDDQYALQRRYDTSYSQCMYTKGNQVPGFATVAPPPPPPLGRTRRSSSP